MRVTDNLKFESFKNSVLTLQQKLQKNQDHISSQKKILSPSDDPVGTSQYIQLTAQQNRNDQYLKNLDRLTTLGGMTENSLNSINDTLTQAKQLVVQMSSDTVTAANRSDAVSEVEGYINQLAMVGNTNVAGTYIFGGMKTDTAPYAVDANYNVTYSGTSTVPKINVSSGQTMDLSMSGTTAFGSGASSVFTILKNLRDGLANNDTTAIKNSLTTIDGAVSQNANNISAIGAYTKTIDNVTQVTENNTLQLKTNISQLMDVDMVSALTDYNLLTTAYEAALTVMGKMQSTNILNYLK